MRLLPEHGSCFVCGTANPHSIGIRWYASDDGTIVGTVALTDSQQGPPKLAHGGASAALLDEAMGAAVWLAGHQVAAVNLNVDYHKPLPLGAEITIRARIAEQAEKAIHTSGEITIADGTVVVSAKGVYVEARHLFTEVKFDRVQ
jgi:uncharacterized protein (TIGR00369 family)